MDVHEEYMTLALALAQEAASQGEVPVGCVIVVDGQVIGRGRNRCEEDGDPTAHAELLAIREACAHRGDWRLHDCTMYVTLEPCPMCVGGIIHARIATVYYGAKDHRGGACGSVLNLFEERFHHRPQLYRGVLETQCSEILQDFFHNLR